MLLMSWMRCVGFFTELAVDHCLGMDVALDTRGWHLVLCLIVDMKV
jgi:hypothetical protein